MKGTGGEASDGPLLIWIALCVVGVMILCAGSFIDLAVLIAVLLVVAHQFRAHPR